MSDALPRIGHYQLLRQLGVGGMGEVYLAHDTRLEREVAIKLLPPAFASDAERVERFRREALALASLSHPNIATLHAIEPTPGGGLALVMEFIAGETLEARLSRGALPMAQACEHCAQVAEAIEIAHERGVVHRDLKPANITITPRGLLKVLDFGLASRGDGPTVEAEGTPGYMSPEQALGTPQDHRTDLFSFGCIFYECLTGRPAFDGPDPFSRVAAAMYGAPDMTALPEALPPSLRALLEGCLAKEAQSRPESMQQLRLALQGVAGRGAAAAEAPESSVSTPHNLPRNLTRFVGRERELQNTLQALQRARLVTLTGVGGCGKTRLALALAESQLSAFPGGVWFIDLAPTTDPQHIPDVLAKALGVREEPDRSLEDTVMAFLEGRRALLVLDNCEHLLSDCAALAEALLRQAPELRVLATSREGLGLSGEQLMAVPSMSSPSRRDTIDAATLERFDAVQLFVERARGVSPDFTLDAANAPFVAEVCRRLDGIPLALELAAARVKVLSVEQIAARLDDRFKLLTGGSRTALPRHQTLRATLQWSHDLLLPPERELLRRLAPFAGGWTLATAARVCDEEGDEFNVLDVLQHLVDKSLVVVERTGSGEARYHFLESVRQFATERLDESGEGPGIHERHLAWILELAEQGDRIGAGTPQQAYFAQLDDEVE
ncbi:MAG: protein kinase, partial [Candidatus Eisenbacteria bacterium]